MSHEPIRVGLVGARGYVGAELIRLLAAHPRFELAYVSSRELVGQRLADHNDAYRGDLRYTSPAYEDLPQLGADAVVLALPNGKAAHIVQQFDDAGMDPGHRRPVRRLSLRSVLVLRPAGADPRAVRRPAPDQQSGLLRHRDATGDRADGATCWTVRCSASACPAGPARAPRPATRTTSSCCATT